MVCDDVLGSCFGYGYVGGGISLCDCCYCFFGMFGGM